LESASVTESEGSRKDCRAAHELIDLGGTVAIAWRNEIAVTGGRKGCRPDNNIRNEFQVQEVMLPVLKTHGAIRVLLNNAKRLLVAQLNDMTSKGCQAVANNRPTASLHFPSECYKQQLEARVWFIRAVCRRITTMKHREAALPTPATFTESPNCNWMYSRMRVCVVASPTAGSCMRSGGEAPSGRHQLELISHAQPQQCNGFLLA